MRLRAGFTLIELIVFVGIFTIAMGAFMAVFTNVASVQVRQTAAAEVRSQSQFLLQTVQYHVERAALIDMPADDPATTLTLRMTEGSEDPTVISLESGILKISSGTGAEEAITSDRVEVSDLEFVKRSNPGGPDSVAVSFTITYAAGNQTSRFAHSLQTAVTRVSAAEFDSDIVPSSSGDWALGISEEDWRSINNTIFFSGPNVGIGAPSPGAPLQVNGDIYIDDSGSGLILRNGSSCFRVTVTGAGALTTSTTTCP